MPRRGDRMEIMKAVVFYESAPDVATQAPAHQPAHRARWHEFSRRGELLMIGPFANAQDDGAMGVFTSRAAAEEFVRGDPFVLGGVVRKWTILDWNELLRSDGNPTYMLAVVVDDHDMGVTHIIRGDDHLTNAARQMQIYQALGWDVPNMAHIPLIHGPDGAKLSKRHGALGVDAYRGMGYLPAALRNYLARLGWSQGDKEFFTGDELIEAFDLAQVHRSPARFDFVK